MERVNLIDESVFETGGGLWTGKKGPLVTATVIRNTNFTESGRIDYSDVAVLEVEAKQLATRRLKPGDIIIERSGGGPSQPVGRVVFFERDDGVFSHSNFTSRLRVLDTARFEPRFVFYFLLYFHDSGHTEQLQRRTTGIRNLDWRAYRESAGVPVFGRDEQRQIAAVLSAVQRAIERQERLIALTAEFKKALMHKLFTEGTRREPQKQTEIGPVPQSWELVRLDQIATIERGKFAHRPRNAPEFYGGDIPFVQTGDVSQCDGRIRRYTQTLNERGLSISKMFPCGTILITIAANIGYTGILEFDSACTDSLVAITPTRDDSAEFLNHYLQTQQPVMDRLAPQGTQKNINIQFLKPWPIPRPSKVEQGVITEDGTTLPLYYNLAPNEMLASSELMEQEFWSVAETEGITDIEELNKILDRAVNLKNFLKGDERVDKIARYVAEHYVKNVEPLGYKAFLVGVDRPACAKYKAALDKYLPPEYSEVVYTGSNNDTPDLKAHHIDEKKEKQVRRDFAKAGKLPKILVVTEKLLTGYDAPVLYAMYLDKPMRDHTLLQAIARVNRPYEVDEGEGHETRKPHGFVLDFVGIFDKLEKALAFDSDEINAIVKDLALLKVLLKTKMEENAPRYLNLVTHGFNDKDVDGLIEHFRDKERRKEFFKEFKELEMLYEIISPDAFLRPYIDNYTGLASMYAVVANAYTKQVYVDRAFQRKTNELVQKHVTSSPIAAVTDFVAINAETIDLIKQKQGGDDTKVINLIKSIERTAEEQSGDPFLIAMAERAKQIQESYEDRQRSTQEALEALFADIKRDEQRKKDQARKGYDSLRYFVFSTLRGMGIKGAESVSAKIAAAFGGHPSWRESDAELRELRQAVTFAVYAEVDDLDEVTRIVDQMFSSLAKTG